MSEFALFIIIKVMNVLSANGGRCGVCRTTWKFQFVTCTNFVLENGSCKGRVIASNVPKMYITSGPSCSNVG